MMIGKLRNRGNLRDCQAWLLRGLQPCCWQDIDDGEAGRW